MLLKAAKKLPEEVDFSRDCLELSNLLMGDALAPMLQAGALADMIAMYVPARPIYCFDFGFTHLVNICVCFLFMMNKLIC